MQLMYSYRMIMIGVSTLYKSRLVYTHSSSFHFLTSSTIFLKRYSYSGREDLRGQLGTVRFYSNSNKRFLPLFNYKNIENELSRKDVLDSLIKCPCCNSTHCQTGVRLNIIKNIDICSYIFMKYYPDIGNRISSEDIIRLQLDILRGYITYNTTSIPPIVISVIEDNSYMSQYDMWQNGYLLTRREWYKKYKWTKYYCRDGYYVLHISNKDLLLLLSLGEIIRSNIRRSQGLLHPNSYPVENMNDKNMFYSSVFNWENVDLLYCIEISLSLPFTSTSREKILDKLKEFIKDEYLYKICSRYITASITHNPKYNSSEEDLTSFGILPFDSIEFTYQINEIIFDTVCWELEKRFPGSRFSRGYNALFLTSIRDDDIQKLGTLFTDLGLEAQPYQLHDGGPSLSLWNINIKIDKGKIKINH